MLFYLIPHKEGNCCYICSNPKKAESPLVFGTKEAMLDYIRSGYSYYVIYDDIVEAHYVLSCTKTLDDGRHIIAGFMNPADAEKYAMEFPDFVATSESWI